MLTPRMAQYTVTSDIYHRESHQQLIPKTQFYIVAALKENTTHTFEPISIS
jgi:hypothetical protein